MNLFKTTDEMQPVSRGGWVGMVSGELRERFEKRFLQGQQEHGCDLGTVPLEKLVEEVERESLDIYAYLQEMKRRYGGEVYKGITLDDVAAINRAIELMEKSLNVTLFPRQRLAIKQTIDKLRIICNPI